LLSLKSFVAEKRHVVMEKLFIKKEEKEVLRKKWTSVRIIKTMGTPMPAEKKDR
jgi:hypothetical protein